jgi:hypothetical protein
MTIRYEAYIECGPDAIPYRFVCEIEPLVRGWYSGPPERCYPDEGGYASILEVYQPDGAPVPESEWLAAGICEEEIEKKVYTLWERHE